MASTQPGSATVTILATVTGTLDLLPTPTETVFQQTPPLYIDSPSGTLSFVNIALVCSNFLVIAILGTFNRLIAVPLLASSFTCVANALDWYGWLAETTYSAHARRIAVIVSNIFYTLQDLSVSLYSFFLLEKILSGRRRR